MDKTKESLETATLGAASESTPAAEPRGVQLTDGATRASVGVYVHFPWCLAKCPYCDFLSVAAERPRIPHEAYAAAVIAELGRRAEAFDLGGRELRSVFFGGGTPSLWAPAALGRVLGAVFDAFPHHRPVVEVTAECNPSSFDEHVAAALLAQGVNRVSIGVQALDDERLRFLGRLHDAAGGLRAVEAAVRAGVPRVSADLIFGVAGQAAHAAAAEVERIAETGITHLSAYALTVEPGTTFGAMARKGRLPLLDEADVAGSFEAVHHALTSRGFAHYEVSNYARSGHVSEHNLGYWLGEDYLGLGCGAWGTMPLGDGTIRYRNTPVPDRYVASTDAWPSARLDLAASGGLVAEVEPLAAEVRLRERIMLGLRTTGGVDVEASARALGVEPWPPARRRAVDKWTARGRLRRAGGHLSIPEEHWLLSDGVVADLL